MSRSLARHWVLALAAAAVAAGCARERAMPEPALTSVTPSQGPDHRAVTILIEGEHLHPRVRSAFGGDSSIARDYAVRLGSTTLENVTLLEDGWLSADVPPRLPARAHDLTVVDPWGRTLVLPEAYRVVAASASADLVSRYELDPVGPQITGHPFAVTIRAVDQDGATVGEYNGSARLADLTGSVLPAELGAFRRGIWTGQVEVLTPHPADVLTVSDERGRAGTSAAFPVTTTSGDRLVFANLPASIVAGTCAGPFDVRLVDALGVTSTAAAPLSVQVRAPQLPDLRVFGDGSCGSAEPARAIAAGESTARFYLRSIRSGAALLHASVPGLAAASANLTVAPAAPASLAFVSPPHTINAGNCSPAVLVEARDSFGNPSPTPAALALDPSSSPSGLTLFDDPACLRGSSPELAAGASRRALHFSATVAGSYTLSFSPTGFAALSQAQLVVPQGAPARVAVLTPARTEVAGACSAAVTLQLQDSLGNPVNATAPTALDVSAAPSTSTTLHGTSGCASQTGTVTVLTGASTADLHFIGTQAGVTELRAALGAIASTTQQQQIVPGPPSAARIASSPLQTTAGACSDEVRVELDDAFGNRTLTPAAVSLSLEASPDAGTRLAEAADPACATAISSLELDAGTPGGGFRYRATLKGPLTLRVSGPGIAAASQTHTIAPAAAAQVAFANPPLTLVAGECSAGLRLEPRDEFGNRTAVSQDVTIELSGPADAGLSFHADPACATAGIRSATLPAAAPGEAQLHLRATLAGPLPLIATAASLDGGAQVETVVPAPASRLRFPGAPLTVRAGECSPPVTVRAEDAHGNPSPLASATSVLLSGSADAGLAFSGSATCAPAASSVEIAQGASSATLHFSATASGPLLVGATATNLTGASAPHSITPADTARFVFGAVPGSVVNGDPFPLTLSAFDAFGNATPAYAGNAALGLTPSGSVDCREGCVTATSVGPFSAGAWSGRVAIGWPSGTGRQLVATAGSATGTSDPIDVSGPSSSTSAPLARFAADPVVVTVGTPVLFDARASTDFQTPPSGLQLSWDFGGTNSALPPWPGWTTSKTASHTYAAAGTYQPRLVVRDADALDGYATRTVIVVPAGTTTCRVDTAAVIDDGASGCATGFGTDGKLSLTEAVRLSNTLAGAQVIVIPSALAISGTGTLGFTDTATLIAVPGAQVSGMTFDVNGAAVTLAGLRIAGGGQHRVQGNNAALTAKDVHFISTAGILVETTATFDTVQFDGCTGACVQLSLGGLASGGLTVRYSRFRGSSGAQAGTGVHLSACGLSNLPLEIHSSELVNLVTGIRTDCASETRIRHNTFHGNGTGVHYAGNQLFSNNAHLLVNNVFTGHTVSAANCGPQPATFAARSHQVVFGNTGTGGDGCLLPDASSAQADPLYLFPAGWDFRLAGSSSPAISSQFATTGLDVNGTAPNNHNGGSPDRGGHESPW